MIMNEYNVIGVMSGTSLDGLDLVYVSFKFGDVWKFQIKTSETLEYDKIWQNTLKNLVKFSPSVLKAIDKDYTRYLGKQINNFIEKHQITELDFVSSHGHTALHKPDKGITYQIGNQSSLCKLLNKAVVCNFRVQDVELGGQGAPLVPIGDELLFNEYSYCLNLGGFANISFNKDRKRLAYDICPVNIVLNHYVVALGLNYDDKGFLASSGQVNESLLNKLNALDFYNQVYPKSLGLEWVQANIFPICDSFKLEVKDTLRTFVEHIAIQITSQVSNNQNGTVLITGGGVYNDFLMERIKSLSDSKIISPSKNIIEFKEALIFAFLGVLRLRNEINCLKSVTGASINHSSGNIFYP